MKMLEKIPDTDFVKQNIYDQSVTMVQGLGLKNGQVLWPFRVALSNQEKSAGRCAHRLSYLPLIASLYSLLL